LPAGLAEPIRPHLGTVTAEMIEAIRPEIALRADRVRRRGYLSVNSADSTNGEIRIGWPHTVTFTEPLTGVTPVGRVRDILVACGQPSIPFCGLSL
jgi:hypothetical protein